MDVANDVKTIGGPFPLDDSPPRGVLAAHYRRSTLLLTPSLPHSLTPAEISCDHDNQHEGQHLGEGGAGHDARAEDRHGPEAAAAPGGGGGGGAEEGGRGGDHRCGRQYDGDVLRGRESLVCGRCGEVRW